ncbi:MAG: hypothetical protein MR384_04995 [Lachnospiraceae bacterium]|nr:hypothetical protein [Lachnospiraceae bacterium]
MYDKNQIDDSLEFCRRVQNLNSSEERKIIQDDDDDNRTADELFKEMTAKIQGIGSTKPWEKVLDDLNNEKTIDYSSTAESSSQSASQRENVESRVVTEESNIKDAVSEETVRKESIKKESILKAGLRKAGFRREETDNGINYSLLGDDYEPVIAKSEPEPEVVKSEPKKAKADYSLLEDSEPENKQEEKFKRVKEEKTKNDNWKSEVNYSLLGDDDLDDDKEETGVKKKQNGTNYNLLGDETQLKKKMEKITAFLEMNLISRMS